MMLATPALPPLLDLPRPPVSPLVARSPADWAGYIAAALIATDAPATGVFGALLGRQITLRTIGPHVRPPCQPGPGEDEAMTLRLAESATLYVREGYLLAGTVQCAKVLLRLVPDRIPGVAWGRIRSGEPCGTVLGPLGMTRPRRSVEIILGDAYPVRCSAVLWLRAMPVGLATEQVPDSLCGWLADRARRG